MLGWTPSVRMGVAKRPGVRRLMRRSKRSWTRSGRPRSRLSRMTSSKNWRPCTGRSKTWVRLTSSCRIESTDVLLALPALEVHNRDVLSTGKVIDGGDEFLVHLLQQRRGHDRARVLVEETAQLIGPLQPGHVAVQVEPVDAVALKHDVIAQYSFDVRHRDLAVSSTAILPDSGRRGDGPHAVRLPAAPSKPRVRRRACSAGAYPR